MALLDFADLIEGHVVNEGVAFGFAEIDMRFIKDSPTEGGLTWALWRSRHPEKILDWIQ